jgi:hypothetical protein
MAQQLRKQLEEFPVLLELELKLPQELERKFAPQSAQCQEVIAGRTIFDLDCQKCR